MFDTIRHPILSIRCIYRVAKDMTPEERAAYRAATTDAEKAEIVKKITVRNFPHIVQ